MTLIETMKQLVALIDQADGIDDCDCTPPRPCLMVDAAKAQELRRAALKWQRSLALMAKRGKVVRDHDETERA